MAKTLFRRGTEINGQICRATARADCSPDSFSPSPVSRLLPRRLPVPLRTRRRHLPPGTPGCVLTLVRR